MAFKTLIIGTVVLSAGLFVWAQGQGAAPDGGADSAPGITWLDRVAGRIPALGPLGAGFATLFGEPETPGAGRDGTPRVLRGGGARNTGTAGRFISVPSP